MVKVRRILVAAISLCLMLGLMFGAVPIDASPGTIVVPDDYPTIQQAIDAASSGDTVYVRPATYYEHVTITKALTLQGEDRETTIVDGSGSGNVIYVTTNHVTISGLTVANGENGIYLIPDWSIHHITVRHVIITSNSGTAFCAPHSGGYHLIEDCIISNNGMASYAHQFGNGIIRNCEVFGNGESFSVAWGSNTQIINNVVHHNANGIYFDSMSNSVIERNIVYANTGFGISNGYVAQDNTVRDNIVCDNGWGIGNQWPTSGNKVYHNDLIGNTIQGRDDAGANIWDNGYPSGGNYWSDYTGVDNFSGPGQNLPGSDGIGDTPYTLSGSQDDYPLMEPFGGHGAGPHTLTISSTDGGNVTTPGEGTFSPYNACEVVDLVATADTGYQFVNWTGDTGTIANGNSANTTITMIGNYSIVANFETPVMGITFSQVDFGFTNATVPNSDWGRIEVDVAEFTAHQGLDEGYLNIYTDGGWVVQNMFIDNASGMENIAMYFNLSVQVGTDVTLLSTYIEFTTEPYVTFGDGPRSDYTVGTVGYNAEGAGVLYVTAIPTPLPLLVFNPVGETWDFKKPNRPGENVQTAKAQCFPMSIANSLQYLENRYGINVPHGHVKGLKGDNSLVGKLDSACNRTVTNRTHGCGVWFDDMLDGKFKYLNENGLAKKLVHRHQGYGYGWVDANHNGRYDPGECQYNQGSGSLPAGNFTKHGITSKDESVGKNVTFEWICEQLKKCEDVEVVFTYENATTGEIVGGHAVRVFGCGKIFGIPYLWYKHDRNQTNKDSTDTTGLEEPWVFVPDLDGDGMPNFGSKTKEICFALSESPTGIPVRETKWVHQNVWEPYANDIQIRLWTEDVDINGWQVTISNFTSSNSVRDGNRSVTINASGVNIPWCTWVKVEAKVWLDESSFYCPNQIWETVNWTKDGVPRKACPASGWKFNWPTPDPHNPGQYLHPFCITNDDTVDNLTITGLAFTATMDWYDNLMNITFPSPYPNFTLASGESWVTNITTSGPLYGGHIYFTYNVTGSETVMIKNADHPVTEPPAVGERDLPADALNPDAEYPGDTFDVYVNFTAPFDQMNAISLTDLAPDGWEVEVNASWCTADGVPADYVRVSGNKVEVTWWGEPEVGFDNGTNFSALYKVTVPETATPGLNEWPVCPDMDEAWLEYYFGEDGPYESCVSGDYEMMVTIPGYVTGETRDVNANLLPDTEVILKRGNASIGLDESTPDYSIECREIGVYWLRANKDAYYTLDTDEIGGHPVHNANHTEYINWSTAEQLANSYHVVDGMNVTDFDFEGDYGLVPQSCTMSYAMQSVNLYVFPPAPAHDVHNGVVTAIDSFGLSVWKATRSVMSWQNPYHP